MSLGLDLYEYVTQKSVEIMLYLMSFRLDLFLHSFSQERACYINNSQID